MYLSRVALDTNRRDTMQALASPQILHGAVESGFPHRNDGTRDRALWRMDVLNGRCYLLVLSTQQPDFTHLCAEFGDPHADLQWESRDYSPLLERLREGQSWRFRLRANPVHSSFHQKDPQTGRGKVFAHVTPEQQKQWVLSRATACGFSLDGDGFDIVHSEWLRFYKKDNRHAVTLQAVTFEGVLTISDREQFTQSLLNGIGRAKAYGCGLLTIARCGGGYIGKGTGDREARFAGASDHTGSHVLSVS